MATASSSFRNDTTFSSVSQARFGNGSQGCEINRQEKQEPAFSFSSPTATRALLRLLSCCPCFLILFFSVSLLPEELLEEIQCLLPRRWMCHPTWPGKAILPVCEAVTPFWGTGFMLEVVGVVCLFTFSLSFPPLFPFPIYLFFQNSSNCLPH